MPKKILFIVTLSEMGGAQRYVMETAPALSARGYEVVVAGGEGITGEFSIFLNSERITRLAATGSHFQFSKMIKTVPLRHLKRVPSPWKTFLGIVEIYKLLKRERPDVLFLCSTMAGLLGSMASLFYKSSIINRQSSVINDQLSIIYRIGGWAFRDPRPWWQRKIILWLEKLTARLKNKIIVNSEIDRQLAIKYKVAKPEKVVKIYNGINPAELNFLPKEEAKKQLGLSVSDTDRPLIGTVANFYKTKGLKYLIEAFNKIVSTQNSDTTKYKNFVFAKDKVQLIIIGDGPERKNLEALIKKYELEDRVFLLGRVPDARRYLKAFDVFVLPSLKEGFPWVILEAMAAELPIIATTVGAIPEITENEKSGLLVEPQNPQVLSEKIQLLLKNPRLAQTLASSAKQRLAYFSKQKMLSQTIEAIEN